MPSQARSRKSHPPMFRKIHTSRWYTQPSKKKRTNKSKKMRKTKVRRY
jgi:hypothetical protein